MAGGLAALAAAGPAFAALHWENLTSEQRATRGDAAVVATYRFKNDGSAPVRFQSLHSNCPCVTAEPSSWVIGPGESGQVRLTMDLTGRAGRIEKEVVAVTEDDPARSATLRLQVELAEVVAASPRMVSWQIGESPREKLVEIAVVPPHTITAVTLPAAGEFACVLEVITAGSKYRLHVAPARTDRRLAVPLQCRAELAGRPGVEVLAYALVQ